MIHKTLNYLSFNRTPNYLFKRFKILIIKINSLAQLVKKKLLKVVEINSLKIVEIVRSDVVTRVQTRELNNYVSLISVDYHFI
jgi:hypothetical protein